jgi:hypothetical protein
MKKTLQGRISSVYFLIFCILIGTMISAHADEPGISGGPVSKSSTAMDSDSDGLTHKKMSNLVEKSTFNQAFKRVKGNLTLLGQRFMDVFSNYSATLPEVSKAVNHLTGGKGFGRLVKMLFLFLLTLAVGFGVEMLFSIPLQKYKRQLQGTLPQSFLQLIARLSARTVLELISFAVFALTIVGLFLIFYPVQSPLYELAMLYLPPIFIIRLSYIFLNLLYSPTAPHMRISPQNCPSAAMYFFGFMSFIIISLLITKTLVLLKGHGMSEGVFLLFYSHVGLFQFIILLAILWMDRARITRLIMKEQNVGESQPPSFIDNIKPLWFPLACAGLLCFELLWQTNLLLYQKDLVLPLLLTILSIPMGFLLFSIGNRLLLIASGQTDLMDPRIVNRDILPEGADISAFG